MGAPAPVATAGMPFASRPQPSEQALSPTVVRSRWRKTQTTFGPLGRVLATVALVLPTIGLIAATVLADPFAVVGVVIWGGIIMPWGLRDTWKSGQVVASR